MPSYSQYRQDLIVDEMLRQQRGGFFLDIGAHDGVSLSNSYFFETERGWDGICVEPNPDVFRRLEQNRRASAVHACVSDRAGVVKFAKVSGHAEMLSGIATDYDPRHRERIERETAVHSGSVEYLDVPAVTVTQLLAQHEASTVDFCSIDTEGGELKILQAIDFSRFRVRVIAVENNYKSKDFRRYLGPVGFELVARAACDEIYARGDELAAGRIRRPQQPGWLERLFGRKRAA